MANLLEDCIVAIVQWLPLKKRIQLECVSHHWKEVVVPRSLANVNSLDLSEVVRPESYWWTGPFGGFQIFRLLLSRIGPHLHSISFPRKKAYFGQAELELLATKCPNLRHLSIRAAMISQIALEQMGKRLNQLESLKLIWCNGDGDALQRSLAIWVSSMTNLRSLEMEVESEFGHRSMGQSFVPALPNSIVSLHLHAVGDHPEFFLSQHQLEAILRCLTQLKKFQVESTFYSDEGVASSIPTLLARHCVYLTHLKIDDGLGSSYSHEFADALRSLTQLVEVDVSLCDSFDDLVLESLCRNCPNVKVLKMASGAKDHLNFRLTLKGLIHLGELTNLKRVTLVFIGFVATKEVVTALCDGNGATVEDFSFSTIAVPNGWRQLSEDGMKDFRWAILNHRFQSPSPINGRQFLRIDVDRVGRRVWLKEISWKGGKITVVNVDP